MKTTKKTTKNTIDFRRNGEQTYGAIEPATAKYIGKCPVTGIRLYVSSGSNDPRGPLGIHAVEWFIASEYGMSGPDMAAAWIACNDDRRTYERALEMAKKHWR